MSTTTSTIAGQPAYQLGAVVLLGGITSIVIALGFEHLGGYWPCPLCLQQRYAYYFAIPVGFGALVLLGAGYGRMAAALMLAVALAYLINTGLGIHHSGVEWGFWDGPSACSSAPSLSGNAGGLLGKLAVEKPVIRCDEASWRFLGLSFAGWNAVISLGLCALAARATRDMRLI
jgi:disulfide bond formation protein DsbB